MSDMEIIDYITELVKVYRSLDSDNQYNDQLFVHGQLMGACHILIHTDHIELWKKARLEDSKASNGATDHIYDTIYTEP